MEPTMKNLSICLLLINLVPFNAYSKNKKNEETKEKKEVASKNMCIGAGPQSPRDIDSGVGDNSVNFSYAANLDGMNLCNVHFHTNAEHKSKNFSNFQKDGEHSGWSCGKKESAKEGSHNEYKGCEGISEGSTIEVHWVYTSCDIKAKGIEPGLGLGACSTDVCNNPQLRVEAEVFTLSKNSKLNFNNLQPVSFRENAVSYIGSTTGTSFSNDHCSPFQVSWNVRTSCKELDIDHFAKWCKSNAYGENHAHGVRELVTERSLLSETK